MYETFYGLKEKPFNLLPDPEYVFMSREHENVYTHLEYAIKENKGFVVVTGEIGSGKTTLINYLLGKIPQTVHAGIVNNPDVPPSQFIKMICSEFELEIAGKDKAGMLEVFSRFLLEEFSGRRRVVLIVDEAQNLPIKTLEEIRLLSNLESEKHHLIQIILVGQPELKTKLRQKGMAQFAQRVTVYCHLRGLGEEEVARYIRHRLEVAGAARPDIFEKEAVQAVYEHSGGIPRIINILCDMTLVYGYADEAQVIGRELVRQIVDSREAGGILAGNGTKPAETTAEERPGAEALEAMGRRIELLDKRLGLLESAFAGLDLRTNLFFRRREQRDEVVIELFRMLKLSMDSRFKALMNLAKLRYMIMNKREQAPPKKEGRKASLISRIRDRRERKITGDPG